MTMASLDWVDGGKDFELRPIPINGQREIQELAMQYAKAQAARQNVASLKMHQYIITAREICQRKGAAEAKKVWDYTLDVHGLARKEFNWDEDQFEENLEAYYRDFTLPAMGAATDEQAIEAVKEKTAEANAYFEEHQEDLLTFSNDYTLVELYWRLRAARVSRIGPSDDEMALDWPRRSDSPEKAAEKREVIIDAIADYCTQADLMALRRAGKHEDDDEPLDMEELALTDEEAVRGKSDPPSTPSTEPRPPSQQSSAEAGGAETRSATKEA